MTAVMKTETKVINNWENDSGVSCNNVQCKITPVRYGRQFLLNCYPISKEYIENEKENNHLFNQMTMHGETIERKYSVAFTKKMIRPKNREDLINWMKENEPPCLQNETSHNGVVYDRWSKNKQKRMQMASDSSFVSTSESVSGSANEWAQCSNEIGAMQTNATFTIGSDYDLNYKRPGKPLLDNEFAIPNKPDKNSGSVAESLDDGNITSSQTIVSLIPQNDLIITFRNQEKALPIVQSDETIDCYGNYYYNNQFSEYNAGESKFKRWKIRKNSPIKKFVPRNMVNKEQFDLKKEKHVFNPKVEPFKPKKKTESIIEIISPKTGLPLKPIVMKKDAIKKVQPFETKKPIYKKPILSEPPILNGEVRYDESYLENKENSTLKIEFYNSKGKQGAVLSGQYEKPIVNGTRKFKKQNVYKNKDKRFVKRKPFGERIY